MIKFELKPETRSLALDICKQLRGDLFMNGKSPKTVAAGVIRYSLLKTGQALKTRESGRAESVYRVRNKNIAQAIGISRDSVINSYNDLKIYLEGPRKSA
jgi:transcription initiation factor TFIIIB Brf1 subunit/transcription initiation factor TFIIB